MSRINEADVRAALFQITRSQAVNGWALDFDFLSGALDSLDHATLALALEEKHGLKISDDDLPKLRTIGAFLRHADDQPG